MIEPRFNGYKNSVGVIRRCFFINFESVPTDSMYYATVITLTGHPSAASVAESSAPEGTGLVYTSANPSSAMRKTSGQVSTQSPQPMQPSRSIEAFIDITSFSKQPGRLPYWIVMIYAFIISYSVFLLSRNYLISSRKYD